MKWLLVAALSLAASASALAQGMKGMDMKDMDMKDQQGMEMKGTDKGSKKKAQSHHGVGKIKSIDASKGTVTIDHGPIGSMSWPAMTMTFKVKDKKMLDTVTPGKKIEFDFVNRGKDHVITQMK